VGFYGGINYGFGYPGSGFYGGVWSGGAFRYNTAVMNVNRSVVHNVYNDRSFASHLNNSRASFNGAGGVNARPTANERAAMSERHVAGTQAGRQFGAGANRPQYNRMNTMARTNAPAQHQQAARSVARTNAPAQHQQAARSVARTNAPVQHQQAARSVARTNAPAQHQQAAHAMARSSAPAQHQQPQMQARRESHGGAHAR
jgi:hypothetical protein